jgi:hypothetical protein
VALAGYDDRVDDRRALAGVGVAYKEPVLLADRRRPDRVFDEVVVEAGLPVAQVGRERIPVAEEVVAGPAEERLRPSLLPRSAGDPLSQLSVLLKPSVLSLAGPPGP